MKILESLHYPEVIVTVSATDKDSGKFGQILYSVSGDGADLFVIDGKSCQVKGGGSGVITISLFSRSLFRSC